MPKELMFRSRRRFGHHGSLSRVSETNEIDTVGLFQRNVDDVSTTSNGQNPSIFTLDRVNHNLHRPPAGIDCPPSTATGNDDGSTHPRQQGSITPRGRGDTPPLDQRYRYHLFFIHDEREASWVEWAVDRLERPPYSCSCCYGRRDFDSTTSPLQNVLMSAALSRRIVFVLSLTFIERSWTAMEQSLVQLIFEGRGRNRMIAVIVEDCVAAIPDVLRLELVVDARQEPQSEDILRTLYSDGVSYSMSSHTLRSMSLQSNDCDNGHLLASVASSIDGICRSRLDFKIDEMPSELVSNSDIALSQKDYTEIINSVVRLKNDGGREPEDGPPLNLSWLFSAMPSILLFVLFVFWCIAFILVILLFPDGYPSTLPVRLCVFSLPAFCIVLGCVLRWRRLKQLKEEYSAKMFNNSLRINKLLFLKNIPLSVTAGRSNEDQFHIYFVYFNLAKCLDRTKLFLTYCSDEDIDKLWKLIYLLQSTSSRLNFIENVTTCIAEELVLMMSSSYSLSLVHCRVPHSLEQRHTRRCQCLCQFLEEFLAAYLSWTRRETNPVCLTYVFQKYLNRTIKPEPMLLQTLGITVIET